MSTDWYTKLVLTVLAVCAALLVARDDRGDAAGPATEEGRFRLQVIPMARMMLKIDSETGATWRASFPEPKTWVPIASDLAETLDDAPAEAPPTDVAPPPPAPPPASPVADPMAP